MLLHTNENIHATKVQIAANTLTHSLPPETHILGYPTKFVWLTDIHAPTKRTDGLTASGHKKRFVFVCNAIKRAHPNMLPNALWPDVLRRALPPLFEREACNRRFPSIPLDLATVARNRAPTSLSQMVDQESIPVFSLQPF